MVDEINAVLETLQGIVERVTFHSEETGFCVLRVHVRDQRELVTVVGSVASVGPGEWLRCTGEWINDKTHGVQFKASSLDVMPPNTIVGMEKYLASGMVRGIGPHFAKRLIKAFGVEVFNVIEHQPEKLLTLDGIGKKRQQCITAAWQEQKSVRTIMTFLQSYGVGTSAAVRIYKQYGDDAIKLVRENPYRLSLDIWGIGFKTADSLALSMGIASDASIRAQAGVRHVLQTMCDKGHCASPLDTLVQESVSLLGIATAVVVSAVTHEIDQGHLAEEVIDQQRCIYPIALYVAESNAAFHLKRLNCGRLPWGKTDTNKAIVSIEAHSDIHLASSQKQAISAVLQSKLSIVTGGPGVGKTTIISGLVRFIKQKKCTVKLCAPTGRAAKRMNESIGLLATTIHRLLAFSPENFSFQYNQDNPLALDVLIIDETSMVDIVLFNHLLKAIPDHAAVIFVGDIDQLPSVGSGAVLADLIASEQITTVFLTEIFRQAAHSNIIKNAYRINQGNMPEFNGEKHSDFFTILIDDAKMIQDELVNVVSRRLPKYYAYDPVREIQVLSPMNRGGLGTHSLNRALQSQLNSCCGESLTRMSLTLYVGDKVIQMVNNYDKEVFNGDIGFVKSIDKNTDEAVIVFDNKSIVYQVHELDELQLAYAISIHKSQGSEFPVVVIPLATQHYTLLAKNLLYTAITRGKSLVILIAQKKALAMAVRNDSQLYRLTNLAKRLA